MVVPYIAMVVGIVVLAGINEQYLARFWWLAPLAVFACIVVLAVTLAAVSKRRNADHESSGDVDSVDERSIPELRDALRGPDPHLAYFAGQALAKRDSQQACECLVEALREEWLPRRLVATLLEGSRFPGAMAVIAGEAMNPEAGTRSWVARLLGRSGAAEDRVWLERLSSDRDAEVRASAAKALARFPRSTPVRNLFGGRWRIFGGRWRVNGSPAPWQAPS